MSFCLTILLGDLEGSDSFVDEILSKWVDADMLRNMAWGSVGPSGMGPVSNLIWAENNLRENVSLYEVLESKIWDYVTVVTLRSANLASQAPERYKREDETRVAIQDSFSAYKDLPLRFITASIGDYDGIDGDAFSPYFDAHILHEPRTYTDMKVSSKPIEEPSRPLVLTLIGSAIGGAFRWQSKPELWPNDSARDGEPQVRLARILMRVVTAGRLADEILKGAFPENGPWAVPPDLKNSQTVPPGTWLDEQTIASFIENYSFMMKEWKPPFDDNKDKVIGILAGIKLFFREFVEAIKGFPQEIKVVIEKKVENYVQNLTFGSDSALRLRFDPSVDLVDPRNALEAIRELRLSGGAPVNDASQWEALTRVCLSSVDGGDFPSKVEAPVKGPKRLIYIDPQVVGPNMSDEQFVLSPIERDVLQLPDDYSNINSLDVVKAESFHNSLRNIRNGISKQGSNQTQTVMSAGLVNNTYLPEVNSPVNLAETGVQGEAMLSAQEDAVNGSDNLEVDPTRHRTSNPKFNKSEYLPLTVFYQGPRPEVEADYGVNQERYKTLSTAYTTAAGFWKDDKGCDHCGTNFHHGVLYLHEPSSEIVHIGHICATKVLPLPDEHRLIEQKLDALEQKWREWLAKRSGSILWRTALGITKGIVNARVELDLALQNISARPKVMDDEVRAQKKFAKWTRRGFALFLLVLVGSFGAMFFTPLPLLILIGSLGTYLFGLLVSLVILARQLARAKYKRELATGLYELSVEKAQHATEELERLSAIYAQFEDWQMILREISHRPFGAGGSFGGASEEVKQIPRPASFVLATAKPSDEQLTSALLQAKKQTIHTGWLTEIYDIQRRVWEHQYQLACLTGDGDDLAPEADNAPSAAIRSKKPITNEDVFYPRADFRMNLCNGKLSAGLIKEKAQIIAHDLAQMKIGSLLGDVEVIGEGKALNKRPIEKFLGDLVESETQPFDPELFATGYADLRIHNNDFTLPREEVQSTSTFGKVLPGEELTAAIFRIDLGIAMSGKKLRGWVDKNLPTVDVEDKGKGPRV